MPRGHHQDQHHVLTLDHLGGLGLVHAPYHYHGHDPGNLLAKRINSVLTFQTCKNQNRFSASLVVSNSRQIEKFIIIFILKYLFRSSSRSRSFSRSVSPRTPQPRSPLRAAKPVPNPRRVDTRRERDKERPSDRSRERERTRFGQTDVDFLKSGLSTMF